MVDTALVEFVGIIVSGGIGLLGVWVAWKALKARPAIRCDCSWEYIKYDGTDDGPYLAVQAINDGPIDVQVVAWGLQPGTGTENDIWENDLPDHYGPDLPHTLRGYHRAGWLCMADPSPADPLHPYVRLGNGKMVKAKKPVTARAPEEAGQ